jgi:hypothetical protein
MKCRDSESGNNQLNETVSDGNAQDATLWSLLGARGRSKGGCQSRWVTLLRGVPDGKAWKRAVGGGVDVDLWLMGTRSRSVLASHEQSKIERWVEVMSCRWARCGVGEAMRVGTVDRAAVC